VQFPLERIKTSMNLLIKDSTILFDELWHKVEDIAVKDNRPVG
jgi:hypothetical protein